MKDMLVVKFGGSSISPPDLLGWVRAVEQSKRPLILVPGGGPFASAVRKYQMQVGYADEAAHHMAILAMEQFGRAMVSLGERLCPCASDESMRQALDEGLIPVWMPAKLALRASEIGSDPTITSDSLAAWFAGRFPHSTLCLVKRIDMPEGRDLSAIAAAGVVDASFVHLLDPGTRVFVAGPSDLKIAGRRLAEGTVPGHEIQRVAEAVRVFEAAS